jgi:hypothetical protein
VPLTVGNPEENYVLIFPEVGDAFRAGNIIHTSSSIGDKCKLAFFHGTQHFSRGKWEIIGLM